MRLATQVHDVRWTLPAFVAEYSLNMAALPRSSQDAK